MNLCICIILALVLTIYRLYERNRKAIEACQINFDKDVTNAHAIGNILYTDYIHLFQLSGMILLVAMIGAIVLTFKKRTGIKRQSYVEQISREKSSGVSLVDVKSNTGVKIDE